MRSFLAALVRLATGVRLLPATPHGTGPAIYFANHASHMDFVVVWAALPDDVREVTSPAAAEDYWAATRLRRCIACELFRAVLIPRKDVNRGNHPVERLGTALEAGRSVILFPEGTRSVDGGTMEFKSGLYHLARRYPDIPLIPVHLENLSRILPKGSRLPVPLIAQARFLPPMQLLPEEPKPVFLARARAALEGTEHP
ncbi:MAG: 1-acyl-sn-glycerol-3-phosphate acyltransferase [Verrucomicrobiales bacterium]|nr:1-acyl-sn-glycerol-3-phosphate acyltransferase [Verrucomicrobiales bacterium]